MYRSTGSSEVDESIILCCQHMSLLGASIDVLPEVLDNGVQDKQICARQPVENRNDSTAHISLKVRTDCNVSVSSPCPTSVDLLAG